MENSGPFQTRWCQKIAGAFWTCNVNVSTSAWIAELTFAVCLETRNWYLIHLTLLSHTKSIGLCFMLMTVFCSKPQNYSDNGSPQWSIALAVNNLARYPWGHWLPQNRCTGIYTPWYIWLWNKMEVLSDKILYFLCLHLWFYLRTLRGSTLFHDYAHNYMQHTQVSIGTQMLIPWSMLITTFLDDAETPRRLKL